MVDVGAHFGIELAMFAGLGWQVYAFEPDPKNRRQLVTSFGNHPRVAIDARAVSDVAGQELAFYTSDVSTGISGLSAFHASHIETQKVVTTTIADYVAEQAIARIDFLKIDVEGFDFFVIKGIDWDGVTPDSSEEQTSELQSLMCISYAVFRLNKKRQILKPHY